MRIRSFLFSILAITIAAQAPQVHLVTRAGNGGPLTWAQGDQNFTDIQAAANASRRAWGTKDSSTTGLTFGFYGGPAFNGTTWVSIPDGIVSLSPSSSNFVERSAAGSVTVNTTAWTAGKIPMALVVTGSSAISGINDFRDIGVGADGVSYLPQTTGAVPTTQAEINARQVNVFELLSATKRSQLRDGTSIPDISTEIQAAVDSAYIGQVVTVPSGNFKTTTTVHVGKGITLAGTGTVGTELTYNQHSQWTIPTSGIAIQIDPAYVGSGANPISQYAGGAFMGRITGIKFQGLGGPDIAARMALNQIAVNIRDGWEYQVDHCDFRNVGTCFAANGAWAVRVRNCLVVDCGFAVRNDPDFALAGSRDEGGTALYQLNNFVFTQNSIMTSGYGIYLYSPFHQITITDNVIQGCTQVGVMAASYNGSLSTAGTDLGNHGDGLTIRHNYIESCVIGIQIGKTGAGSLSTSAPHGVMIADNFFTFQGVMTKCLYVLAAVDLSYKAAGTEPYSTPATTPDVVLDPSCYTQRCVIEAFNGWSGDFNGDTTSSIRKLDSTYRASWVAVHVDPASGSKITVSHLWAMNAGSSSFPFDSLATAGLWLRRVLHFERTTVGASSAANATITLHAATYPENLSFDGTNEDIQEFDVIPDGSAGTDSIIFSGISINQPYTTNVAGGGKIVFNVDPSVVNPNVIRLGARLKLDTVKLQYASPGAASTKGFFVYDGGILILSNVTNYDTNKPYYGIYSQAGTVFKNGTVPSGSNTNEFRSQGGIIRGATTFESENFQFNAFFGMSNGADVASSGSITPTAMVFNITGSTATYTINLPFTGFFGTITMIPTGTVPFRTGGNINANLDAVVGQPVYATWNGSKWFLR